MKPKTDLYWYISVSGLHSNALCGCIFSAISGLQLWKVIIQSVLSGSVLFKLYRVIWGIITWKKSCSWYSACSWSDPSTRWYIHTWKKKQRKLRITHYHLQVWQLRVQPKSSDLSVFFIFYWKFQHLLGKHCQTLLSFPDSKTEMISGPAWVVTMRRPANEKWSFSYCQEESTKTRFKV